jgi:hypothetical protein
MTSAELATGGEPKPFKLLDKHGRDLAPSKALATISAGYMQGDRPVVSRDGTMYLHDKAGRAPNLKAALEKRHGKALTIAFMSNDLNDIIKQRWAAYSRGSCLWSGDEDSFLVFQGGARTVFRDDPEYDRIMARPETKLRYSIHFYLAEWLENDMAEILLGDGKAPYRIRTSSYNSASNLVNEYNEIRKYWRGPFKGIPFELTLVMEEGNGPDGKKRNYPVFQFLLKPRGQTKLTSGNFRKLVLSGNKAAEGLSLPAPADPTPDDDADDAVFGDVESQGTPVNDKREGIPPASQKAAAAPTDPETEEPLDAEYTFVEPTDAELKNLEQNKNPKKLMDRFFAAVSGSHLDGDEARAEFLGRHVDGVTSLKEVVQILKPHDFKALIASAQDEIAEQQKEDAAQEKLETPKGWHETVTPAQAKLLVQMVRHTGLNRLEVYPFISMVIDRPVVDRAQVTADDINTVLEATGSYGDDEWAYAESKAADLLIKFDEWQVNEGAAGVL